MVKEWKQGEDYRFGQVGEHFDRGIKLCCALIWLGSQNTSPQWVNTRIYTWMPTHTELNISQDERPNRISLPQICMFDSLA